MRLVTAADGSSVAVVVSTRNSARTIERCLRSLRDQTYTCTIVVVDNGSTDGTPAIAARHADVVIQSGPERSRQRNVGASAVGADVLGFIDADMAVSPTVVEEAAGAIASGAAAVIVPETTSGHGYWARVRQFERSFYRGVDGVEAARFFSTDVFQAAGQFDEDMTGAEDWDLTLRARPLGPVARTTSEIVHDEGHVRYTEACAKKAYYADGLAVFARRHGTGTLFQALDRPYLRRPWRLLVPDPGLGAGVVALKTGELVAVAWNLLTRRSR